MAKAKHSNYRPHKRVQELGDLVNVHTGQVTTPPSMTKQEFVREADINNIIKQYSQSGMLSHVNAKAAQGAYQDLPDSIDFQESLHIIQAAEAAFMTLPAKVRDRFGQDPQQWLAFMEDPNNNDEIRTLGLAKPLEEAPPPLLVEVLEKEPKDPQPKA